MANNTTLPGTGETVEDLDIGAGVKRQVVSISPRDLSTGDSIGSLTEAAPGTDTASAALNGRLQRIAQRLTAMIALLPTAVASVVSTALGSSLVLSAAACSLFGFQVNTTSVGGWVLLFDATAAPADGAVTPRKFWQVPPNTTVEYTFTPQLQMVTGAVLVFSTTGPFTKTASATAAFSGEVR